MSDLFKELRFMALRSTDDTKVSHVISESTLRKEYNFTDFYKLDDNKYRVTDLYLEGRVAEKVNYPPKKPQNSIPVTGLPHNSIIYTPLGNQSFSLYASDLFTRKPKGELLSAMKLWIKEKEDFYEKLYKTYSTVKKEHKDIYLLPISLKVNFEHYDEDPVARINHQSALLTSAFKLLITKITSRKGYEVFLHYTRVILLDNRQQPFLHVVLYYKESDISDFYLRDLTRIWCEVVDKTIQEKCSDIKLQTNKDNDDLSVEVDYVYFDKPFPSMHNDEYEDEWKNGKHYSLTDSEIRYGFEVSATDLPSAFNPLRHKNIIVPLSKKRRTSSYLGYVGRFSEADSYLNEAEFKKWMKGIKQDQKYHTDYLERIAKQYVKIPDLNNLSHGVFTYKK